MTRHELIEPTPLVYGGVAIREKGEMLSLTDMWKAAGSPENREPFNWSRFEGKAFIEAVAIAQNLSETQVLTKRQGRNGGTHAHWQIGLAYAKYLNHDFHMWCNQVVRERMEGHGPHLPPDVMSQLDRIDGISRMLSHKITMIEKTLPAMLEAMTTAVVSQHLAESNIFTRRGKTAKELWDRHSLPPKLRGATLWLGNRLDEMGCGSAKADRGNGSIRLFDPDLAEACLKNGLMHKAKDYASERMGQGRFKLVTK